MCYTPGHTIDRQRLKHEAERFEKLQQSTNRRLDLDKKRFAVEVEERKQLLEERKKIVDVMELLAKKKSRSCLPRQDGSLKRLQK